LRVVFIINNASHASDSSATWEASFFKNPLLNSIIFISLCENNFKYVLLEYDYIQYCQGTADRGHGFALIHLPQDATTVDAKSLLFQIKNKKYNHEIDIDSIEDATIEW